MRTPQLTEQYGHVDFVWVAPAILSSRSWAWAGVGSSPRSVRAVPPTVPAFRKSLRVLPMTGSFLSHNFARYPKTEKTPRPLVRGMLAEANSSTQLLARAKTASDETDWETLNSTQM